MSLNKVISVSLILSQLWAASGMAATAGTAASPEFKMISRAVALGGKDLSSNTTQADLKNIIAEYQATAPTAGREERLEQSLIDLRIYQPEQAKSFIEKAEAEAAKAGSSADLSTESSSDAMSMAMQDLTKLHPAGAEFSSSDDGAVWGTIFVVSLAVLISVEIGGGK
jgi:hypothetical protein